MILPLRPLLHPPTPPRERDREREPPGGGPAGEGPAGDGGIAEIQIWTGPKTHFQERGTKSGCSVYVTYVR